jgi:parallel beta-helix repeat protein
MFKRAIPGLVLALLLTGMVTLAFSIKLVKAAGPTIYVRADGSVDPSNAPIERDGDVYTFSSDIFIGSDYGSPPARGIVVERDNITIEGNEHLLQGVGGVLVGIDLSGRRHVTVKNAQIKNFGAGIYLFDSSNDTVSGNNITNNNDGIRLGSSSNNTINGNSITNNGNGIELGSSSNNTINGNNITNNWWGIELKLSMHTSIIENYIVANGGYGIHAESSLSDSVVGNNINANGYEGIAHRSSSNSSIVGNTISHNARGGIWLSGTWGPSNYNNIIGNTITANNGPGEHDLYSGIFCGDSSYTSIVGNSIANQWDGIYLQFSHSSNIIGNSITAHNQTGVWLQFSSDNIVAKNIVANNRIGVHLQGGQVVSSSNNTIIANTITTNSMYGIKIERAPSNFVYQNNFINNGQNAFTDWDYDRFGCDYTISWDNGDNGGNYWSDHSCVGDPSNGDESQWYHIYPSVRKNWNIDRYPFQNPINLETSRGDLCVRVTDSSGTPIEGVLVTASYYRLLPWSNLQSFTDSEGCVLFSNITSGTYTLCTRADGYYPSIGTASVSVGQNKFESIVLQENPQTFQSWAVIVGVSHYAPYETPDGEYVVALSASPFCDFDSLALYNLLSSMWGEDHIKLLLNEIATKQNINNAVVDWLAPKEQPEDGVLVFFSGHGNQSLATNPPCEYITPYDFDPRPSALYDNRITDFELDAWLDNLDSKRITVMLDSCYSGGFIKELSKSGRIIITACDANETASLPFCFQRSLFTHFVLESFLADGVDANMDGMISWQEIFSYAEPRVTKARAEQHPQVYYGYSEEPIITIAEFSRVLPLFLALLLTTALLVSAKKHAFKARSLTSQVRFLN